MTQHLVERPSTPSATNARLVGHDAGVVGWVTAFARELAVQDWFIAAYFVAVLLAVAFGTGPGHAESASLVGSDIVILWVGLILTRGGILARGTIVSQLVYRLTLLGTVLASYLQLRVILPAVSSRAVDAQILAFDLRVFHFEPSIAWDRFVSPWTTEWFAFFYFGYFFVLAAHVLPFLLVVKRLDALARFSLGIFMVFCTGHLLYMVVPGYGPYRHLAGQFGHELSGGIFWDLVKETVAGAGAQKDIFPSLHTAVPTFFTLFSLRNRNAVRVLRYTWPIQAFVTTQIIVATMFLRWHYLIDIFAGLLLATLAVLVSERLVAWETSYRARAGIRPAWVPLPWRGPLVGGRAKAVSR
jgi:hypothetical protein